MINFLALAVIAAIIFLYTLRKIKNESKGIIKMVDVERSLYKDIIEIKTKVNDLNDNFTKLQRYKKPGPKPKIKAAA